MSSQAKIDIWNRGLSYIGHTERITSPSQQNVAARIARDHWDDKVRSALESRRWPWARKWASLSSVATQSTTSTGDGAEDSFQIGFAYSSTSQVTVTVDGTEQTPGTDYNIVQPDGEGFRPYVQFTSAPANGTAVKIAVTVEREGWEYVYSLPSDCITPLGLVRDGEVYEALPSQYKDFFDVVPNDDGSALLLVTNQKYGTDFDHLLYIAEITDLSLWPGKFKEAMSWAMAEVFALSLKKDTQKADYCRSRYEKELNHAAAVSFNSSGSRKHGWDVMPPSIAVRRRWRL